MLEDTSQIRDLADFREFLSELATDFKEHPEHWEENPTLDRYLEAVSAWADSGGCEPAQEQKHPFQQVADMLLAGRVYE